ncbi:MAG: IS200/IS605 family transposase [Planctomycetales bacterium]
MSSHVYHEIFLHFNWHTKDDSPILIPTVEPVVHKLLRDRCQKAKGVYLHGIGGTETHVHLAIAIEPHVIISELVKDLKGGSSHDTNQALGAGTLGWQRGYGVVSFGKRNLPWVLEYIAHQKEHHA